MKIIEEDFEAFVCKEDGIKGKSFDVSNIKKYCSFLGENDSINVIISCDFATIGVYDPREKDGFDEMMEAIENYMDEVISVEIHIQKSLKEGYVTIYSFKDFSKYLYTSILPTVFLQISSLIEKYGAVRCLVCDKKVRIETASIIFSDDKSVVLNKAGIDKTKRKDILNKLHEISYMKDDMVTNLLPQDFKVIDVNEEDGELSRFLEQVSLVLCIAYIVNHCELQEYSIRYRLMGYKLLDGEYCILNMENISTPLDILFKIYTWIYAEDFNTTDKCEIARNILSLHIKNDWLELGIETYMAIVSGYRVYLKSSVNNYLQIKNDVVDKIVEINGKLSEIAKGYASKVKNNLLALFSFWVTTLIINTIETGKIENIFTRDITILSYAFIVVSLGYLFINYQEVKFEKDQLKKMYDSSKELYTDVLNEEDIRNIYCNDSTYNNGVVMLDKMIQRYSLFWILSIVVVSIIIWLLKAF